MEDIHFMIDRKVIKKIITSSSILEEETVLEIGAGKGQLTVPLSEKGRVVAIEKDRDLADFLKNKFRGNKRVKVVHGNALKEIKKLKFDKIVSNLPYSICQPLFQLLPYLEFSAAFLTIPKRFSERLGHLPYSAFFETKMLFPVPRSSFDPPPKTESVFVEVGKRESLLGNVLFLRKNKLKNAIMQTLCQKRGMTKKQAREALKTLNLNTLLEKRVQSLTLKELKKLEQLFQKVDKTIKVLNNE